MASFNLLFTEFLVGSEIAPPQVQFHFPTGTCTWNDTQQWKYKEACTGFHARLAICPRMKQQSMWNLYLCDVCQQQGQNSAPDYWQVSVKCHAVVRCGIQDRQKGEVPFVTMWLTHSVPPSISDCVPVCVQWFRYKNWSVADRMT